MSASVENNYLSTEIPRLSASVENNYLSAEIPRLSASVENNYLSVEIPRLSASVENNYLSVEIPRLSAPIEITLSVAVQNNLDQEFLSDQFAISSTALQYKYRPVVDHGYLVPIKYMTKKVNNAIKKIENTHIDRSSDGINKIICLFVWFLTTHQPLWVISARRYKLNMMKMEKVKNYKIK